MYVLLLFKYGEVNRRETTATEKTVCYTHSSQEQGLCHPWPHGSSVLAEEAEAV